MNKSNLSPTTDNFTKFKTSEGYDQTTIYQHQLPSNLRVYQLPHFDRPLWSVTTILEIISKGQFFENWKLSEGNKALQTVLAPHFGEPLSEELLNSAIQSSKNRPSEIASRGAEIGSIAHDLLSRLIDACIKEQGEDVTSGRTRGAYIPVSKFLDIEKERAVSLSEGDFEYTFGNDLWNVLESFQEFCDTYHPIWVESERAVYRQDARDRLDYAGTVDALCKIGERPFIIDFKTSKSIYDHMALQVSAYANALEEGSYSSLLFSREAGSFISPISAVLQLSKDRVAYDFKIVRNPDEAFRAFIGAYRLWKTMRISRLSRKDVAYLDKFFELTGTSKLWQSNWTEGSA